MGGCNEMWAQKAQTAEKKVSFGVCKTPGRG